MTSQRVIFAFVVLLVWAFIAVAVVVAALGR